MLRSACVAGTFYPGRERELREEVQRLLLADSPAEPVFGVIAPHAGYVYSGPVAGKVYARVVPPESVILLAPNHTGYGAPAALWSRGTWRTPLGDVAVDEEATADLSREWEDLTESPEAHLAEHSGEVHLPFLQTLNPQVKIAPIVLALRDPAALQAGGEAIARVVTKAAAGGRKLLVVASTDMNHFADDATTRRKDALAIARVEALDPEGLLGVTARERISMCGVGPTAALLYAARALGRSSEAVVRVAYDTSATASGDRARVVGYFGALIR